jgi:hypothetical protein
MYGRQVLTGPTLLPTRVSFDGLPRYKAGAITLDLTLLPTASGSPITLPDASIIPAGIQFLRYGQVCCKVTTPQVSTVTIAGTPTGGTFALDVASQGSKQITAPLAYNATAAAVQAALAALGNVGVNNVTVSGSAGGPYTVTFAGAVGVPYITADGTLLTGGTSPTATATLLPASGTAANTGYFGPYDPTASDGRQTLTRGECFVLDETFVYQPYGTILPGPNEVRGGAIDGGAIWLQRVIQAGAGTASLAAGPTLSAFLAAFPAFQIVEN